VNGRLFSSSVCPCPFNIQTPADPRVKVKSRYSRHCKQLAPAYATAATFLEDFGIYLAAVDCQDFSELCDEHGVNSWPTLRVYRGNPEVYEGYEGGRGVEE